MAGKMGLYQKAVGGVWYTKRGIPEKVRGRLFSDRWRGKSQFVASTGEHHLGRAELRAKELWAAWGREIEEVRALGAGEAITIASALVAINRWRLRRCTIAAGSTLFADLAAMGFDGGSDPHDDRRAAVDATYDLLVGYNGQGGLDEGYFNRNPEASRSLELPVAVALLLSRLQVAVREPAEWISVPGFDEVFDDALAIGGCHGFVPQVVRDEARHAFAQAYLEVVQHEEAQRRRAAWAIAARSGPAGIRVQGALPSTPAVREGGKTLGDVIDAYAGQREGDDTQKAFSHIFRALKECLGVHTPVRSITPDHIIDVRNLLRTVPRHASKLYPGVSLSEAAERAAAEDKPPLSHNTVRSYLVNASAVFNWAKGRGFVDENPVAGLIGPKRNSVRRRGFTSDELIRIFNHLANERQPDSAHLLVPLLAVWTGARANELCQLHVADVKFAGEIPYLDLTVFDSTGRRTDKKVKNAASDRAVPLHPELIAAGFLDHVNRRRDAKETKLFPELSANSLGYYSHEVSRQFARALDKVGLTDAALCLHSARHSFRNAGRQAGLASEVIDSLGGWSLTTGGVGPTYGDARSASVVADNAAHLAKITMGDFRFRP
ncbi:hypothetical protein BH10PSE1_BH10PSE1_27010 [soil metagenome]